MPFPLYAAVESPEKDMVPGEVDKFFKSSMAQLAVYPFEISYDIVEIRAAWGGDGGLDPNVEDDILRTLAEKDAEIANAFRTVSQFMSESGRVIAALSDPDDIDVLMSRKWAEAFASQGRSLTAHHTGSHDPDAMWAVHEFTRALQLVEYDFHYRVGFFDLEQLVSSPDSLRERVSSAPEMQWVATVDLKIGGNAHAADAEKARIREQLENTIDDLAEYIRDLCIKYHNAPFEACDECAPLLNQADDIINSGSVCPTTTEEIGQLRTWSQM